MKFLKKAVLILLVVLLASTNVMADDTDNGEVITNTTEDVVVSDTTPADDVPDGEIIVIDDTVISDTEEKSEGAVEGSTTTDVSGTEGGSEMSDGDTSEPVIDNTVVESTENNNVSEDEPVIGDLSYEVSYNGEHTFATVVIAYSGECEEMTLANQDIIQALIEKGIYEINYDLSDWVNTMAFNIYSNGLLSFDINVWGEDWETPLLNKRIELVITDIAGENKYTITQGEATTFTETNSSASMSVSYTNVSSYTWSIPADLSLNSTDKLQVSASNSDLDANTSLKIKVSSANNFIMKGSNPDTMDSIIYTVTDDNGTLLTNSGNNVVLEYTSSDVGIKTNNLKFTTTSKPIYTDTYSDTLTFTAQIGLAIGAKITVGTKKYTILDQYENGQYLVMERDSIGNIQYNPNKDESGNYKIGTYETPVTRPDGNNANLYEGSYIDNYLNDDYYNSLPTNIQNAIVQTTIKQNFYSQSGSNPLYTGWQYKPGTSSGEQTCWYNEGTAENPNWVQYYKHIPQDGEEGLLPLRTWTKQDKGYNGTVANEITRKIFLPSVEEISKVVDLNSQKEVMEFVKNTNGSQSHLWLRDSRSENATYALYLDYDVRSLDNGGVTYTLFGVRPAYILDFSNLTYSIG